MKKLLLALLVALMLAGCKPEKVQKGNLTKTEKLDPKIVVTVEP